MSRRPRSRPALTVAALIGALAALLIPAAASAAVPETALSPALATLAEPQVATRSTAGQEAALDLPRSGPGSLVRIGGKVVVEAHFDGGAIAGLEAAKEAGAQVLDASRRYQTLALAVQPTDLGALAAVPGVDALTAAVAPRVGAVGGPSPAAIASNGLCEGGSVITQGLTQLKVAAARGSFEARGAGETIAVISDSFDSGTVQEGGPIPTHAHEDEVTNDLPGPASTCSGQQEPVKVIAEDPPGQDPTAYTDEGRAMLQVVHDLAPHAKLAFATGSPTELSYALNIEKLAAPVSGGGAGADVIVDDLSYYTEPFYQDGPVAVAIRRVTEKGVLYLSAAANENLLNPAGEEIASWEAPKFRSSSECSPAVVALLDKALAEEGTGPYEPECMDFDPSGATDTEFGFTVDPGVLATIGLQWAEPRYGVKSDFLGFVVAGSGGEEEVVGFGGDNDLGPQPALEIYWPNETSSPQEVRLVIARCAGTCNPAASSTADPRLKFEFHQDGGGISETEYPKGAVEGTEDVVGPTIYGHDGSAAATTVAAVNWRESSTAPREPERYSSRGPVTHYFGPVVGATPAAALPSPEVISKPDLTATDCASNTFLGEAVPGVPGRQFCGTSEAVEHAGTIAALMQQTEPLATPAQIVSTLESTATAFTVRKAPFEVGAGMVDALAAMRALGGSPAHDRPSYVVPSLEEEANAPAPTVTITNGPKALGNVYRPTFEFVSSRPVAFSCQIDGGPAQACASPFVVPSALGQGPHGFVVIGTDAQGRAGSSGVYGFTVDTKAPRTKFVHHPKKVVRTKKKSVVAHFRVRASESPVTFYCQVDKEALRICGHAFRHRFRVGKHAVRVRAKDQAGNLAAKQTVFHFRVRQIRQRVHRHPHRSVG
jgi:hypothetical protein